MKKNIYIIVVAIITTIFLIKSIIGIYKVWTRTNPPAKMIQEMNNPTDGDSLVLTFESISNDSMKFFYSIDSTGVIDSIFVNLCYYRIFCGDSTISFKIIYE